MALQPLIGGQNPSSAVGFTEDSQCESSKSSIGSIKHYVKGGWLMMKLTG